MASEGSIIPGPNPLPKVMIAVIIASGTQGDRPCLLFSAVIGNRISRQKNENCRDRWFGNSVYIIGRRVVQIPFPGHRLVQHGHVIPCYVLLKRGT